MSVEKFGRNIDIDSAAAEDVWDGGGTYVFTTTAQAYHVSSSSAADTQEVGFELLTEDSDGNWNEEIFTQTIAGQTETVLAPPSGNSPIRINRFWNADSSDFAGDVYVYEDDTVTAGVPQTASKIKAKILIGNNQTLMAIYTVPSTDKGAKISSYYWAVLKRTASLANAMLYTREFGGVFRIRHVTGGNTAGTSTNAHEFRNGIPIPARTDIKIVSEVSANDTDVSAGFLIESEDK